MSYLYKKANWLWPILIRHRLVHAVWRPLVELTRRRHVRFRKRLEKRAIQSHESPRLSLAVVSAGV
jgi:hypothetical protein